MHLPYTKGYKIMFMQTSPSKFSIYFVVRVLSCFLNVLNAFLVMTMCHYAFRDVWSYTVCRVTAKKHFNFQQQAFSKVD